MYVRIRVTIIPDVKINIVDTNKSSKAINYLAQYNLMWRR